MAHSTLSNPALLGRFNQLKILRQVEAGLFLDAGADGEILLPQRFIPQNQKIEIGELINVFVYLDGKGTLIATTKKANAEVGQFAVLKVVEINDVGIFLDWGLPKDLMLPYSEETHELDIDDDALVYLYLDRVNRITATMKIEKHLDQSPANYSDGEKINLLVAEQTEMGFKVIINHTHWGLVHNNELFRELSIGMKTIGYIKNIRPDGKIDISLQAVNEKARETLEDLIMKRLSEHGGILPLSDKSSPADIAKMFNVSKANFKRAIGGLFREKKIIIEPKRILVADQKTK